MSIWYLEDKDGKMRETFFRKARKADVSRMNWTKGLSWTKEISNTSRSVYVLIDGHRKILGGLSLTDEGDHVFIHLIESAPETRFDAVPPRVYVNISRLLIAFAGMVSNNLGYEGFLAFTPKTEKREYFATQFNAFDLPMRKMGIDGVVSNYWIRVYYK